MAAKKKAPAKKAPTKKTLAKKPVAKKASAKKAVAKKAPVKKAPAKKAPVKKATVKKAAVKKAVVRKAQVKKAPVKKSPVKKAAVKKAAVKKAAVKKAAVKKAPVKKAPAKRPASKVVVSEIRPTSVAVLEPTTEVKIERSVLATPRSVEPAKPSETEKKRRLGFFLLVGAVALFGFALISNSGSSTEEQGVVKEEIAEESPAPVALEAPVDVFADYTPTGGKVTWSAPSNSEGLKNYLLQASFDGGDYVTLATLAITESSFEVMKVDTPSATRFRVVAVYETGEAASEPSEIKGKYEAQS